MLPGGVEAQNYVSAIILMVRYYHSQSFDVSDIQRIEMRSCRLV